MARASITIHITVAWWVRPVGYALLVLHRLTGWKPKDNGEWLVRLISRHGIKVVR